MTTSELLKLCEIVAAGAFDRKKNFVCDKFVEAAANLAHQVRARLTETGVEGRGDVLMALRTLAVMADCGGEAQRRKVETLSATIEKHISTPPTDALAPQSGKKEDGWLPIYRHQRIDPQPQNIIYKQRMDDAQWFQYTLPPLPSPPSKAEGE